jgi:hypothetical protein
MQGMTGQKRTNTAPAVGRHRAVRHYAVPGPVVTPNPCAEIATPTGTTTRAATRAATRTATRTRTAGRRRAAPAPVLVVALGLLGTSTLAACGGSSSAGTTLRGAAGVTVVAADGSTHPGVNGEQLTAGESVRTTSSLAAVVTGGRVTTLGPSTSLDLLAPNALQLDQGTVVVDRRHGSDLTLTAGPVTVSDLGRTAVRVERGFAVRVAAYDGGDATLTAGQRSATLSALHEFDVPGSSLPATSTPLALRDDALDAIGSPDLVAVNEALVQRAAGLDAPSAAGAAAAVRSAVLHVLPAADTTVADTALPLSERVLPVAIARADPGAAPAAAYSTVSTLRAEGGSWGVVAALVGASLANVQQQITDLIDTPIDSAALTTPTPTASAPADGLQVLLAAAATPSVVPTAPVATATTAAAVTPSASPSATRTVTPTPTPTPTTTPLLTGLLGGVLGLLPHASTSSPSSTRSAAAKAEVASPTPTPTPSSSVTTRAGLLSGLL